MTIQEHSTPNANITDFQTDRINILELIGQASAASIKLEILVEQLKKTTSYEIEKSFEKWVTQLPINLNKTSKKWSSTHSYWTSRDKLVNSYCCQFRQDLQFLLRQWAEEDLEKIIKYYSDTIYQQIRVEFDKLDDFKMCYSIEPTFVWHKCMDRNRYNYQKYSCDSYTSSYTGDNRTKKVGFFEGAQSILFPTGIAGGVGLGARAGLGLLGFALPVIPVTLAIGSIASIINIIGTDEENSPELYNKIKAQIIELGCADIKKNELPKVRKDIIEQVKCEVFTEVMNCAVNSLACVIAQYESIYESLECQADNN